MSAARSHASAYASLLSPGRIGTLALRNRIVLTSMGVCLAEDDGTAGDRIVSRGAIQVRLAAATPEAMGHGHAH